ncbi:hypothetical protein R80B4_00085 [Fibrobacteres bacterium R8-0-B4]
MPKLADVERPKRVRRLSDFKPISDAEYERRLKEFPWLENTLFASMRRNRKNFEALRINGKSINEIIRDL